MSRPNQPRTIGAEDRLRERVRRFMEENERGPTWFARQMNAQGCETFTSTTLAKILSHGRAIYVDEGIAMACIMGRSLDDLT